MAFRFEGLEIFHAAIDFSAQVHETVKKFMPVSLGFRTSAQCLLSLTCRREHAVHLA